MPRGTGLRPGEDVESWTRRARMLALAMLCLATMISLGGCDLFGVGPSGPTNSATTSTTTAPPTLSATTTPVPWMGAPHASPSGWSVYYAPHFSIALPPEWRVEAIWMHKDPGPEMWRMRYVLYASPGLARGAVEEWDDLSTERVRDDFCMPTADYEARTVAGLSMRFSRGGGPMGTGDYSPFERDWTFVSDQGTVYNLWVDDSPNSDVDHHLEVNRAVVETFAPQYASWGCP